MPILFLDSSLNWNLLAHTLFFNFVGQQVKDDEITQLIIASFGAGISLLSQVLVASSV